MIELPNPMGVYVTELRTANIASRRVRAEEPAPQTKDYEGDALGPGHYKRFVVLSHLAALREHRAPLQEVRVSVRAYAPTFQDAAALYGEISDFWDNAGPRTGSGGIRIYQSLDETGASAGRDPVTDQPFMAGVFVHYSGERIAGS